MRTPFQAETGKLDDADRGDKFYHRGALPELIERQNAGMLQLVNCLYQKMRRSKNFNLRIDIYY